MLWPTTAAVGSSSGPRNSNSAGSTDSIRGALATIDSVMPVRTVTVGAMARPGFTRVENVPSTSPPLTFTAPISVIMSPSGEPPVVSRSMTEKVHSESGGQRLSRLI